MRCPDDGEADLQRLLEQAAAAGLSVSAAGGRLVLRGPRTCDQALVQSLLDRKNGVMRCLLVPDADEHEAWLERAAIAEHDGELPRADAETLAWGELQEHRAGDGNIS
jgi:hypothetical protein